MKLLMSEAAGSGGDRLASLLFAGADILRDVIVTIDLSSLCFIKSIHSICEGVSDLFD
jgi:hypothetical protein